jgi:hypothetical protein
VPTRAGILSHLAQWDAPRLGALWGRRSRRSSALALVRWNPGMALAPPSSRGLKARPSIVTPETFHLVKVTASKLIGVVAAASARASQEGAPIPAAPRPRSSSACERSLAE